METTPTRLTGDFLRISATDTLAVIGEILDYLTREEMTFKLKHPRDELELNRYERDQLGFTHLRFQRVHKDIPVHQATLDFHINPKNILYRYQGNYPATFDAEPEDTAIDDQQLVSLAGEALDTSLIKIEEKTLIYWLQKGQPVLCWKLIATTTPTQPWQLILDAGSFEIYSTLNLNQTGGTQ